MSSIFETAHKFPKLFEHGFIGCLEIESRIVMAPISTNLAGAEEGAFCPLKLELPLDDDCVYCQAP
jgi:hypothetical protein